MNDRDPRHDNHPAHQHCEDHRDENLDSSRQPVEELGDDVMSTLAGGYIRMRPVYISSYQMSGSAG
jgi:hypothetical protein